MKDHSRLMGGLYKICEWVMRFTIINLLWVIFNLPLVFIFLNILFLEQKRALFFFILPLIIFIPILFFPATTAMFASARDWVIKDEYVSVRRYWSYYKENYLKSLMGGFIFTIAWTIWAVDYYYFSQENIIFMGIFFIIGIVLLVYTVNFFSVMAHYHMKLGSVFKNSLIITIGSPVLFFTVLISNSILIYLSLNTVWFLLPFFAGALMSYLSFSAFYRFYYKVVSSNQIN
ncbi:YesL family protein [Neobacillus thermocopriae]|nr:DUF624 domain-containing protein [Neobacillus thermocopriae]